MNRTVYAVSCSLFAAAVRCLWGYRATGVERVPKQGPVLFVANHASFLDPLFLGVRCGRQVHYVARASLRRIPVVGAWMQAVGVVFVDRDAPTTASLQRLIDLLRQGAAVGVFPEGTRSADGRVGPFKRGVQVLLKKTGATVVPAGIRGSFAVFPRGRRFPRLFRRCSVTFGDALRADEVLAEGGLEEVRRRVARLCDQPLTDSSGPPAPGPHDEVQVTHDTPAQQQASERRAP